MSVQLSLEEKKAIASDLAVSGALALLGEILSKPTRRGNRQTYPLPKSSQVENLFEMVLDANSISEIASFAVYQENRHSKELGNKMLYANFRRWLKELKPLFDKETILTSEDKEILTTFVRDLKRTIKGFEKMEEKVLQDLASNAQFVGFLKGIKDVRGEVVNALANGDKETLKEKLVKLRSLIIESFNRLPG